MFQYAVILTFLLLSLPSYAQTQQSQLRPSDKCVDYTAPGHRFCFPSWISDSADNRALYYRYWRLLDRPDVPEVERRRVIKTCWAPMSVLMLDPKIALVVIECFELESGKKVKPNG